MSPTLEVLARLVGDGSIALGLGGPRVDRPAAFALVGNVVSLLGCLALAAIAWRARGRGAGATSTLDPGWTLAVFLGLVGLGRVVEIVSVFRPIEGLSGPFLIASGLVGCYSAWSIRRALFPHLAARSPAGAAPEAAEPSRPVVGLTNTEAVQSYLATLVETSHDAIIGKDLDGRIISWNAGAERIFGYNAAEVVGGPITVLLEADRLDEEVAILERLRRGESVEHYESTRLRKDGRSIDVSLTISPIKDGSGRIVGISKIARDVTDRKKVEDSLHASEKKFRQLADAMPQIVWTAGPDGHVDSFNQRWYDLTGRSRDENGDETWMPVLHDDDVERCLDVWHRSVETGEPYQIEYRFKNHATGDYRWHLGRALAVKDEGGRVVRWIGTSTDIDDRKRAEERLHSSERIYRAIGESIPFGIWICDPDGRNTYASNSFLRLIGITQEQCSDFGWGNLLHPDDSARTIAAWRECVEVEGTWDIEHRFRGVDGRWHPILARGVPVRDDGGRLLCWAGINLDIGRLKMAEEALRASEERQRRALEAARLAHWEWDIVADRTTFQDSLQLLYGRPDDRPFANFREFQEIIHPDDLDAVRLAAERAMTPGVPYEVEFRIVLPDGSIRWLGSRGATDFDAQGTPTRMVGVNLDITDRKKTEHQVLLLNETLEHRVEERTADLARANLALLDSKWSLLEAQRVAGVGSWEWDPIADVVTWSDELYRIAARDPSLPPPTYADHDSLYTPESLAEHDKVVSRALEAGDPYEIELEMIGGDGVHRWIIGRGEAVRDEAGRVIRLRGTAQDVTERHERNEELLRARDLAWSVSKAKGNFLANMSHEIRTPMNGVIGMTELLMDTQLNNLQRDYAETIRRSGEALLTVINDILDFSKIEAGKLTFEAVEIDLRTLMEEVADLLAPRVHQKSLEISCRVAPGVPGRLVGDPIRIRQVLTNLAGNAVKFTDRGAVELGAELLTEDEGTATVRIQVRDSGIGIPEDRHADVFDSFTQVEGGSSRKHGGTGLGLAICRKLVGLMGGSIGLESRPGSGSTFWFDLTLGKGRGEPEQPEPGLGGLRVLVVDDQESSRSNLREALLSWDCRPEVAASGVDAIATLLNSSDDEFGLILLDQEMPGLDGKQTALAIKATPRYAGVPIVLLSSQERPSDPGEALAGGLWAERLTKPVRRSQLYNTISRIVAGPESSPARDDADDRISPARPLRILLAEDNDVNRCVAIGMVERLGCTVESVCNGREAVAAVDRGGFDLVLMDVQMPEMDGFAATAAIRGRELGTGRHIPIVALTAHAMQGDRERCLAAGMDGYLAKPIRPGPLAEALREWGVREDPAGEPEADDRPRFLSFSTEELAESCGGNAMLTSEVLRLLLREVPGRIERLGSLIDSADRREISYEAHGLKGVFLTVGAGPLASACQELRMLGDRGDLAALGSVYTPIRNQWACLQAEATRYLESLTDVAAAPSS